jgi:hypothetical protein
MKEQFENAITLIKKQENLNACIAGSAMLGYQEDWNQDIDIFCYDEQSFTALLYFMHYNPMFNILDKLELHKFNEYTQRNKSSLASIGLITLKFTYNLCIPINIVFKKYQKNIFDVLSAFDIDLIAQGYCLKTGKYLSLRESKDYVGTYNSWNTSFHIVDQWSCRRLIRQFLRVIKYTERGYDLTSVTEKYISMIQEILDEDNIYKTQKGTEFYDRTQKEFSIVLQILQVWKLEQKMTPENQLILQTFI